MTAVPMSHMCPVSMCCACVSRSTNQTIAVSSDVILSTIQTASECTTSLTTTQPVPVASARMSTGQPAATSSGVPSTVKNARLSGIQSVTAGSVSSASQLNPSAQSFTKTNHPSL